MVLFFFFFKFKDAYSATEDNAVEGGHGDGNSQRLPFSDANVELWHLTRADITAEKRRHLLREVHSEAKKLENI